MADLFVLQGSYTTTPAVGCPSGYPSIGTPLDEQVALGAKHIDEPTLISDLPYSVAFGGVTSAHVIVIKTTRKVRARITSSDGSAQSIPVDSLLILTSLTTPITALDLTRDPGVTTQVEVMLGQRA